MPFYFYIIIGVVGFFLLLFCAYLFLLKTSKREELSEYKGALFAHRGLHNCERAENSMSAFLAAADKGYGIELDVRLSSDGELVVFHDDTLLRVCGIDKRVDEFTAKELAGFRLSGTEDGIPLFSEVLSAISGRVPILVEIKEDQGDSRVSSKTAEILKDYKGKFLVQSFNPLSVKNVKKKLPSAVGGILCQSYWREKEYRKIIHFLLGLMVTNIACRPSFIAFNASHPKNPALLAARLFFRTPTFAWTVRNEDEGRRAKKNHFDALIFENYIPEK